MSDDFVEVLCRQITFLSAHILTQNDLYESVIVSVNISNVSQNISVF